MPQDVLQADLGHESLATTSIYVRAEKARTRRAMQAAFDGVPSTRWRWLFDSGGRRTALPQASWCRSGVTHGQRRDRSLHPCGSSTSRSSNTWS